MTSGSSQTCQDWSNACHQAQKCLPPCQMLPNQAPRVDGLQSVCQKLRGELHDDRKEGAILSPDRRTPFHVRPSDDDLITVHDPYNPVYVAGRACGEDDGQGNRGFCRRWCGRLR